MPPPRQLAPRFAQVFLLAALALTPGAGAAAQVIEAVAPPQGALGTVLTISGSGFGRGRPTIFLVCGDQAGGPSPKFRLGLVSWSDGEIRAEIGKALAGPCVLHVLTAAGGPAAADFEVMAPQAAGILPATAVPGDQVVISGAFFGTKALKVSFFGKRATLVSAADDAVTVVVPAGLPDGQWTARVTNPLGDDWADAALTVAGGSAAMPADFVRALIGGARFIAHGDDLDAQIVGPQITFDASQPGSEAQQLSVHVPFNVSSSKVPSVFSGAGVSSQPILYLQTSAANGSSSLWLAMPGIQPWEVAIAGRSGSHLAGTLDAVLVRVAGPGPDKLVISDGQFVVTPHF